MGNTGARILSTLAGTGLVIGGFSVTGAPPGAAATDARSVALSHLTADASGALTLRTDATGRVTFAGVPAGEHVDDPGVSSETSVADAADAAIARYGAAFGGSQPGTALVRTSTASTVAGDVARYQQEIGGVPVLGGQLVVALRADRGLDSILARTSATTKLAAPTVSEVTAASAARAAFVKRAGAGATQLSSLGRWVLDAGLIGGSASLPTRTVWRFEVSRGETVQRSIMVDDRTGGVLMNTEAIETVRNRIVCDNNQVLQNPNVANAPCVNSSANLVRTEAGAAAALPEANTAFDLGGVVYDNYLAFGGIDLTNLIGRVVDGGSTKALAQTVRWCYSGSACPYANAFWNGSQMYYGTGYAGADDVVGHEMTHGVTERSSDLFYWGQSGAMNESISDIMGEIIDHRNVTAADVPATQWALGEDLPGFPTGLRNVQDPTSKGDPDRTSSAQYVKEGCCSYPDEDGVHTNSGVGNKTFYLASQGTAALPGGLFNGVTIPTGIDNGDPNLTKSAKLWLLTDQSLSSGSDYADEAAVLDQSCQALLAAGSAGFTAADCTVVHQATTATQLTTTPTNNPQPADAAATCPAGTTKRELFNSETGAPATKFVANPVWSRSGVPGWGQVAHSGPDAWGGDDIGTTGANSLVTAAGIALPAGQSSFLHFQQWRLLEYEPGVNYDAGTVEVDNAGDASPPVDTAALPWVNGPTDTITTVDTNPAAGRKGFGNDSRGYLASRLDLSSFAGATVKPQFTMNTDSTTGYLGWWVDDVSVYTCDVPAPPPVVAGTVKISGKAVVGKKLSAVVTGWTPAGVTFSYQWLRKGAPIAGATGATYKLGKKDKGKKISVRVTGSKAGSASASATSAETKKVKNKKKHHGHHGHHRVTAAGRRLE